MTDSELLFKKTAFIETCVRELREVSKPELISTDVREERFIARTLQIAIQATIDIASHIVAERRLGEPETNRELFFLLERDNWIDHNNAEFLAAAVGFRNIVVHGYEKVSLEIMRNMCEKRLGDLLDFCSLVRARLSK